MIAPISALTAWYAQGAPFFRAFERAAAAQEMPPEEPTPEGYGWGI